MLPELTDIFTRINDLRGQVRGIVADLPADALNWRPVEPGEGGDDHVTNSLAVMAVHVAGAEHFWVGEVTGGLPATRDRPQEFVTEVDGPAPVLARLDAVAEETRQVFERLTAEDLARIHEVGRFTVSGRWGLLHVIDHTSLHLGHMQLTYQLWNRGQATNSPRWFERLPQTRE